jgi:hypothetical protein
MEGAEEGPGEIGHPPALLRTPISPIQKLGNNNLNGILNNIL